jgi:hypothetical protein
MGVSFGLSWLTLQPAFGQLDPQCRFSQTSVNQKDELLQASLKGPLESRVRYQALLAEQAKTLQTCRRNTWPRNQAIWLRLYPCDIRPGVLDRVLDQVINLGYNQVYVETFFGGQVLLPAADNPSVWPSVITNPSYQNNDLLAEAIAKGHDRGIKVYAWMWSMNFGSSYGQRTDRQGAIAVNGWGQTSLDIVREETQVFIDPYNPKTTSDYSTMVNAVLKRKPDGILFDYIRFPRGSGTASVVDEVRDLPIYGPASQNALLLRAQNNKGREIIRRYMRQGSISPGDVAQINRAFPGEDEPRWQGRIIARSDKALSLKQQYQQLQQDLWLLTVAHTYQGVTDFLRNATLLAQKAGVPPGAVFFPGGNQTVGQGFDSRLQPWDRFPGSIQWHPMAYAACSSPSCILAEVRRVIGQAQGQTRIQPALAGVWGRSTGTRPPLEVQMKALRSLSGRIDSVSHFAYSWTQPDHDRERKACQL